MTDHARLKDRPIGSDDIDSVPNVIAMLSDTGIVGSISLEPLFEWLETRENIR